MLRQQMVFNYTLPHSEAVPEAIVEVEFQTVLWLNLEPILSRKFLYE